MVPRDVLPGLADPRPGLLCEDLDTGEKGLRVPLVHRSLGPVTDESRALLATLPDIPSVNQLRALLSTSDGIGLFAPALIEPGEEGLGDLSAQWARGSILLLPPTEWKEKKAEVLDWQFDGVDVVFKELPYGPDDILCFSAVNFSPDAWFMVLRGPMAGAVCWWTHDGDSVMDKPWAADLAEWGRMVFKDPIEAFGGVIRPTPMSCIDGGQRDVNLYPERYLADMDDSPAPPV